MTALKTVELATLGTSSVVQVVGGFDTGSRVRYTRSIEYLVMVL